MKLNPYLTFNGNCEAAFKFYAKVLDGKIEYMLTHGGSPMPDKVKPEWQEKIMHVTLSFGDNVLMGSDAPPEFFKAPAGISVTLNIDTPAEAERVFNALAENGTVQMPIQGTFWAERFGMLADQFGTPWMINCAKPM